MIIFKTPVSFGVLAGIENTQVVSISSAQLQKQDDDRPGPIFY